MILGDLCLLVTAMTTLFWNSVLVDYLHGACIEAAGCI